MFDWPTERAKLKQDILKTLRDQKDLEQHLAVYDKILFEPSGVKTGDVKILGTWAFNAKFTTVPQFLFGQKPYMYTPGTKPFVVQPFIANWRTVSGAIDGFSLGVLALTDAPLVLGRKHTIWWRAEGRGSRYRGTEVSQRWTDRYNSNTPSAITHDDSSITEII